MRRKLNEEEYNEKIELGVCSNIQQASNIVYRLKKEGIDAFNEDAKVVIYIERDKNNPHYIDDIKEYAMNIFNEMCGGMGRMKLACSKKKTVKLTESKLKNMIKEAIYNALNEL